MKNKQTPTFKNATGKIDYTLMNDCMFHSVMTQNGNVLKGLVCALLRLKPDRVHSITILNPYELGSDIRDKNFILDIKILLNDRKVINIELQVRSQRYWNDRSLIYLCRLFDNLEKGSLYSDVMPAYHISILNVTPFDEHPEFYATNKMMNVKKHYVYNDKFTLNVLDLNQIGLATDEDKKWKLDYWARLFKATTWEGLQMLAQQDSDFQETCETIFRLNQNKSVRYWCQAREEADRIARSIEHDYEIYRKNLAEKDAIIADQDNALAEKDNTIAENKRLLTEKDSALAEKDSALAEKMTTKKYLPAWSITLRT